VSHLGGNARREETGRVGNAAENFPRGMGGCEGPGDSGCTGAFWWTRAARVPSSPAMRREGSAARCAEQRVAEARRKGLRARCAPLKRLRAVIGTRCDV
jgi:hypothetical protein